MSLRSIHDPLPDPSEIETVAQQLIEACELLAPRRRWSVEGMVEPIETPVLDPALDAAPPDFLAPMPEYERWIGFFAPGDHDFVRRQSEASLERVIVLDEVPRPRPEQLVLRLCEPLLSRDRTRVLCWANLLQPHLHEGRWKLYVHRLGELALERVDGRWTPSVGAPQSCKAFAELER